MPQHRQPKLRSFLPRKTFRTCAALALSISGLTLLATPAHALSDTNLDTLNTVGDGIVVLSDQPSAADGTMPANPEQKLPSVVDDSIPNDATVISPALAVTDDGTVQDLKTGDVVTDPELLGTPSTQADPLAKTDGDTFIPVGISDVENAVDDAASGKTQARTRSIALDDNEYGAHWGVYNGSPAFFEADGTLFAQQAKGVIDVSEWQYDIDWEAAKADGVDGAIIRLGYGWGNGFDKYAVRNIGECKRLGIPFGVYVYSYAYDAASGAAEGDNAVTLLRDAGVNPGDLSYPVFYDLERWTWTGHTPPTDPAVYDEIVNAWYGKLQAAGYDNLAVYSYTSYLNSALNSTNIHGKTRWVASYGTRTGFDFQTNDRGWQYTSGGSVDGITGRVDLNAFGIRNAPSGNDSDGNRVAVYRLYNSNNGLHHYTTSLSETNELLSLGWNYEGISFYAANRGREVFRLYNPNDGNHLYATDANERTNLIVLGWNDENIAWYMPQSGGDPVYRLYNPYSGEHIYTMSYEEYLANGELGWQQEGIAWYSL